MPCCIAVYAGLGDRKHRLHAGNGLEVYACARFFRRGVAVHPVAVKDYIQNADRRQSVYGQKCQLPQKMLCGELFNRDNFYSKDNPLLVCLRVGYYCDYICDAWAVLFNAQRCVQASGGV